MGSNVGEELNVGNNRQKKRNEGFIMPLILCEIVLTHSTAARAELMKIRQLHDEFPTVAATFSVVSQPGVH